MRTLTIFGLALLGAAAFLGTGMSVGCGSDSVSSGGRGGSKASTKKGGTEVTSDDDTTSTNDDEDTSGTGGSSTSAKGGAKNVGGSSSTSKGGSDDSTSVGSTTTGDSITLTDGLYESSSFSGYLWTAHDKPTEAPESDGSQITPACGDSPECFKDKACVSGYTAAIPKLASGEYDYSGVWGAQVGWNLYADDTATQPQDVSGKESVTVGLTGKFPSSLRVQMDVPKDDGTNTTYCATLTLPGGEGTVKLASLKTECWGTTGTAFDPATMKPKNISVQVTASKTKADFDFCVTKLTLD